MATEGPPPMQEVSLIPPDDDDLFASAIGASSPLSPNAAAVLPSSNSASNSEPFPSLYPPAPTLPVNSEQPSPKSSPPSRPRNAPLSTATVSTISPDSAPAGNSHNNSHEGEAGASPAAHRNSEEDDVLSDLIDIKIGQPQRVGDGMTSYVTYAIHTKTSLAQFRSKELEVRRRFSDFLGLREKLVAKHLPEGRIVPPAPEKSIIGMTQIKMSKEDMNNLEFVERRRLSLERYLRHTATHPVLRMDPDLREFLELERELPHASQTSALSSSSVLKMFSRTVESLGKLTFHMPETDMWFKEKLQKLEQLESTLGKLHAAFETLVQHRREVASAGDSLNKSLALLASSEENGAVSRAFAGLSNSHLEKVYADRASFEFYYLSEELRDIVLLLAAVKDAFNERVKCWKTWKDSEATLEKKREAKVRLELAHKMDKVAGAEREIKEYEEKVESEHARFERLSETLKKEYEWFERVYSREIKRVLTASLEALMATEQKAMEAWEQFGPEAKAIA